jgi:hypothetical protein
MKIVIVASPEVRTVCPPDFIEGRWMEAPGGRVEIKTPPGARPLAVRPNGKWQRNFSGETAPVYEIVWEQEPPT